MGESEINHKVCLLVLDLATVHAWELRQWIKENVETKQAETA